MKYSKATPERKVWALAAEQFGVIGRAQALEAGMPAAAIHHRIASGRLERVHEAVYRLPGVPGSWRQRLMAGLLLMGDRAAISYRRPPEGIVLHRVSSLEYPDVTRRGPFRLTTVTRTLIDLAAVVDEATLEAAVDDGLRRRLTALPVLRDRYEVLRAKGRKGIGVLGELIASRDSTRPAESLFEVRLRRTLVAAGLPEPVAQYEVRDGERFVARVDLAYPDYRVAIEALGFKYHSGKQAFERDVERRGDLNAMGLLAAGWQGWHERSG